MCSLWGITHTFTYYVDRLCLLPDLLGLPISRHKFWDGSQVPSCYCMLLIQPSLFRFFQINPPAPKTNKLSIQIIHFSIIGWIKRSKFYGPHIKLIFLTILTSSLSCYSCQMDDSTKRGTPSVPLLKVPGTSAAIFPSICYFTTSYTWPPSPPAGLPVKRLTLSASLKLPPPGWPMTPPVSQLLQPAFLVVNLQRMT
jgi:hypothetical protein